MLALGPTTCLGLIYPSGAMTITVALIQITIEVNFQHWYREDLFKYEHVKKLSDADVVMIFSAGNSRSSGLQPLAPKYLGVTPHSTDYTSQHRAWLYGQCSECYLSYLYRQGLIQIIPLLGTVTNFHSVMLKIRISQA
jgi:hypothetical protein